MAKKKTKRRELFEKAYAHFSQKHSIDDFNDTWPSLSGSVEDFIEQNWYRSAEDTKVTVMSAIFAILSGIPADDCSENCKGGVVLFAIYQAGRWNVLHDPRCTMASRKYR